MPRIRNHYHGDPTFDLYHPGTRPTVPLVQQHQQRQRFEAEPDAGPNVAVLGDPLPGRSALDKVRQQP